MHIVKSMFISPILDYNWLTDLVVSDCQHFSAGEFTKLGRFIGHSAACSGHFDVLGNKNYVLGFG